MRQFMVLVGPNGAGKTNVIHALDLLGEIIVRGTTDPAREQGWDQIVRRGKKPARGGLRLSATIPIPGRYLTPHHGGLRQPSLSRNAIEVVLTARLELSGSVASEDVRVQDEEITLERDKSRFVVRISGDRYSVTPGTDTELWSIAAGLLVAGSRRVRQQRLESEEQVRAVFMEFFEERSLEQETRRRFLRLINLQRFFSPALEHVAESCTVTRVRLDSLALRAESSPKQLRSGVELGPHGEGLAATVDRLKAEKEAGFGRVLAALQSVYPRIEDVRPQRIQADRLTLLFKEKGIADPLEQASISDGVLHALALLVMLESHAKGVLAIEEPENAIHPWSIRAMVGHAQEHLGRQLILTTHSETVVNAVKDARSLYIVEHVDEHGTTIQNAADKEQALDAILKESGQRLGEVWLSGALGGVPISEPDVE